MVNWILKLILLPRNLTRHIWTLPVSQGNTLLTEGFFGLSFLFNNLTLAVAFDATHYRLINK